MAKVAIILVQGFADWEYGLIAGTGTAFYGLEVRFFTPEPGEVRSLGSLATTISDRLDAIPGWSPEVIAVIGSPLWETPDAPDLAPLLRAYHADGGVVAGICGGTLALARAGLLDGVPHTSNDGEYLGRYAAHYAGAAHFRTTPEAVSAGGVITAPGTAPAGFAAAVLEAAGTAPEAVAGFRRMLAAEHAGARG